MLVSTGSSDRQARLLGLIEGQINNGTVVILSVAKNPLRTMVDTGFFATLRMTGM